MLVSVDELKAYMSDVNLTERQWGVAESVLQAVQEELELYLNRPVESVQVREYAYSDETGFTRLSVSPVHAILSITASSRTIPTNVTYEALAYSDAERIVDNATNQYAIIPGGVMAGGYNGRYLVEYVGGYRGYADEALKRKIKEVASRVMTVRHDDSISIKDGTGDNPTAAQNPTSWTLDEFMSLRRLKRRVLA